MHPDKEESIDFTPYAQSVMEPLDYVDACMQYLGSSLNLLDPNGSFKSTPPQVPPLELFVQIMKAVKEDYRTLSDAIHALREK